MNANDKIIELLKGNLYSIEPVIDQIDKKLMSFAYTPGVGTVCLDIQKN
jgi:malic enzyme